MSGSWSFPGVDFGGLGGVLGPLGGVLGPLGGSWVTWGVVLGSHGAVLGRRWGRLEALLRLLGAILEFS